MLIGVLCLLIATLCRSIAELQQQGKLRLMQHGNYRRTFWDEDSYLRKYKLTQNSTVIMAPNTWYYRLFKIKYKERFPLSATFLVFLTDGMHLMQFCYHLFLSASLASFSGINFFWFWPAIPALHALGYRIFQR